MALGTKMYQRLPGLSIKMYLVPRAVSFEYQNGARATKM